MEFMTKETNNTSVQPDLEIEPRFYTLDQTARYLNVSRPQVYSLVRSGELPAIKLGGRGVWRVDRHQLEGYIERLLDETREWARAHPLAQERSGITDESVHESPDGDEV
jgi:excisionase family DNA binding protein